VRSGAFREDLYYRINIVKLVLPPLRSRKEDIPLLVDHFIRKFNHLRGREIQGITPEALNILISYDFPGNIRELENIIEYSTLVSMGRQVGIEHLPESLQLQAHRGITPEGGPAAANESSWTEVERGFIYEALRKNNWSRKLTAAQLGIHPTTLWRKARRLELYVPRRDPRVRYGGGRES
jgi:transcriptional regulator with PAS, ATPase and Fis domain